MPVATLFLDPVLGRLKSRLLGVIAFTCINNMSTYRYAFAYGSKKITSTHTRTPHTRSFISSHQQPHSSFSIMYHHSPFIIQHLYIFIFNLLLIYSLLLFFRATQSSSATGTMLVKKQERMSPWPFHHAPWNHLRHLLFTCTVVLRVRRETIQNNSFFQATSVNIRGWLLESTTFRNNLVACIQHLYMCLAAEERE